jgi:hypothetical protein
VEPLLSPAEKKGLQRNRAYSFLIGELCDRYPAHIQNPKTLEGPKGQVNSTQRLRAIKEAFGERSTLSLQFHKIKDWLIAVGLPPTPNRYKPTLSAVSLCM